MTLRLTAIASIAFDPTALWFVPNAGQSSSWEDPPTQNDTGVVTAVLADGRGQGAADSVILASPRVSLSPSGMVAHSIEYPVSVGIQKRILTLQESAAGAQSAPANVPMDLAVLARGNGIGGFPVLAAGSIAADGSFVWHAGAPVSVAVQGPGFQLTLGDGRGIDPTSCVGLIAPRRDLAASPALVSIAMTALADETRRILALVEEASGGASTYSPVACDFVIIGTTLNQPSRIQPVAMASVTGGVAPSFVHQDGFEAAITRNGVGDYTLKLAPGRGYQADKCAIIPTPRGSMSLLRSVGVVHVSATEKRFTLRQEGAGGAVSELADFNFDAAVFAEV